MDAVDLTHPPSEVSMSERNWKEEQQDVLMRLFDAAFGRREASEKEVGRDTHRPSTAKKHPDDHD